VATATIPVERRALYYPWVHFHSDDWVKKALLVFPGLFRMVADHQVPNDTSLIYDLRGSGLIRHANLDTPNALDAQRALQLLFEEDLTRDPDRFKKLFGKEAAQRSGQPSFQMNPGKASGDLFSFLERHGLVWVPENPHHWQYRELHPDLGQAVMGTIAMACAEDAGLHILGVDSPRGKDVSSELNSTLAARDRAGPYRRFVRKEFCPGEAPAGADQLFHTLVRVNCDVSKLDARSLVQLQEEREPLRILKQRAQELAAQIPEMKDPDERERAFRDGANDIIKAWKKDKANLLNYSRTVFGLDALGGGVGRFVDVMKDKLIPIGAAAGPAVSLLDATSGIAIALLTHVGVSYGKVKKQESESPWRYMTLAEDQGATFSISTTQERDENLDLRR
jgi:hypothetical protein